MKNLSFQELYFFFYSLNYIWVALGIIILFLSKFK